MFGSSLSRSGTISQASIRSSSAYNNFNANYSIKAEECERSRAALDHAYDRSLNTGLLRHKFTSMAAKTPTSQKKRSTQQTIKISNRTPSKTSYNEIAMDLSSCRITPQKRRHSMNKSSMDVSGYLNSTKGSSFSSYRNGLNL